MTGVTSFVVNKGETFLLFTTINVWWYYRSIAYWGKSIELEAIHEGQDNIIISRGFRMRTIKTKVLNRVATTFGMIAAEPQRKA